ncbi:E3 ubiquitin protein ligase FANCL, putative [Ixodes scapularis]|uniref:E3 ubiquitin protein ligase FANCL, putative n=1 Tax=Ixodes scapularis TaxID=6945 RepID=B7QKM0_IXOSC|nr:E3 ubiquitin protein ligase FANCL, putative [Ixodes scapularis]|eukprot:XP_002415725.1 E3 ubiquitin protein ligase FANCL, putative [Ixodes scapularis]
MADLDARCWVLDPPCPRAGDAYRRIALGKNVSMMVVIDPHTPMTLPRLEFTGPEAEVTLHEKAVQDNVDKWDPSVSISANLSALLGFEVPSRENATSEEVDCTCGICYSFLLDGAVPDKLCQNSRCSRPFHQSCLSEWMRSLPMVRQNFNMFFGECPYCSEPMSCRM